MTLTLLRRGKPLQGLTSWLDDMDSWFDYDFSPRPIGERWLPPIDIVEKAGTYLVKADLPGLKKEDIHLELHDGYLTLRGERKSGYEEKKEHYRSIERTYGAFERRLRVPDGLTVKDIRAHYRDGVLELAIPATKQEKPRKIEVTIE